MADYAITGKKGNGKSLTAIGIIRDALRDGKRVATNLNVNLDVLMASRSKKTVLRIPDHPNVNDLKAIGRGQAGKVEEENGLIILDECSHFFNARQFGDKGRSDVLEWLTQSRKLGWDVYYIMQGLPQLDKQIRETQVEYSIIIKRTDKWPIPFITPLSAALFGDKNKIKFPKGQLVITKHGVERDSLVISRRWYRSQELYEAYDTQQIFQPMAGPNDWDFVGIHTQLSAWHLKGRYLQPEYSKMIYLKAIFYYLCLFASYLTRQSTKTLVLQLTR